MAMDWGYESSDAPDTSRRRRSYDAGRHQASPMTEADRRAEQAAEQRAEDDDPSYGAQPAAPAPAQQVTEDESAAEQLAEWAAEQAAEDPSAAVQPAEGPGVGTVSVSAAMRTMYQAAGVTENLGSPEARLALQLARAGVLRQLGKAGLAPDAAAELQQRADRLFGTPTPTPTGPAGSGHPRPFDGAALSGGSAAPAAGDAARNVAGPVKGGGPVRMGPLPTVLS